MLAQTRFVAVTADADQTQAVTEPRTVDADPLSFESWLRREDAARRVQHRRIRHEEAAKGNPHHNIVCRYWIDGKCAMGARCFYEHRYRERLLPLCQFIQSACPDGDGCMFRHFYLPGEARQRPRHDPRRAV